MKIDFFLCFSFPSAAGAACSRYVLHWIPFAISIWMDGRTDGRMDGWVDRKMDDVGTRVDRNYKREHSAHISWCKPPINVIHLINWNETKRIKERIRDSACMRHTCNERTNRMKTSQQRNIRNDQREAEGRRENTANTLSKYFSKNLFQLVFIYIYIYIFLFPSSVFDLTLCHTNAKIIILLSISISISLLSTYAPCACVNPIYK